MTPTIFQYWTQVDGISHLVAYCLVLMSLLSWFLILSKAWSFWRIRRCAKRLAAFWQAPGIDDALAMLQQADHEDIFSPLARHSVLAADTAKAATGLSQYASLEHVLTRVLRQEMNTATVRLESGLSLLASVGATAPFVGLLGTVWGVYHALSTVAESGAVQIAQVAGPVGEALIMTALGLIVAIPAVLAYNGLHRVNRITLAELDAFAYDLHAHLSKTPAVKPSQN